MAEENKTWWFGRLKIILFAKDTSDTGKLEKNLRIFMVILRSDVSSITDDTFTYSNVVLFERN